MLKKLWEKIKNEPVIAVNLVNALFALAVSFGLDITMEQKAAIIGIVTLFANIFARQMVTPTRKLPNGGK